jgi:NCAIR mutase (PurE)-related protein
MNASRLREILADAASGRLSVEDAVARLRNLPFEDLSFARIDHHRSLRQGFPEAILCDGKPIDEAVAIARRIVEAGNTLIATRVSPALWERLGSEVPGATYNAAGRVAFRVAPEAPAVPGTVLLVTGGTSDLPVAEEASATLDALRVRRERLYDVGVAGIHRVLAEGERLRTADVIVAIAGMEGALASVVGGLVSSPVIAVPTSIGYGASLGGLTTLLAMLSSCAQGVTVVNIDNGFGAACAAHRILQARAAAGAGNGGTAR